MAVEKKSAGNIDPEQKLLISYLSEHKRDVKPQDWEEFEKNARDFHQALNEIFTGDREGKEIKYTKVDVGLGPKPPLDNLPDELEDDLPLSSHYSMDLLAKIARSGASTSYALARGTADTSVANGHTEDAFMYKALEGVVSWDEGESPRPELVEQALAVFNELRRQFFNARTDLTPEQKTTVWANYYEYMGLLFRAPEIIREEISMSAHKVS